MAATPRGAFLSVRVSARSAETSGSDRTPFIVYTINAPELPYKIQQYAEENLQPELARIEGISQVDISGATPMEWILEYDLEQLRALGITTSDITGAVNEYVQTNYLGMAHTIDLSGNVALMRLAILPQGEFDVDNLSQIPVKKVDGTIITLDKLVRASHQQQKPSSYYRINGLNTVSMRLFAEKSANQLELSRQVRETMDRLIEAMPPGFEVSLSNDTTEYIRAELDKIYFRSGLTVAILLLFVLVVSRSFRYLAMILFSMVSTLAISAIFYYLAGVEIHITSLAGITISLCLIIDNTIVMADQLKHRRNFKAFLAILAATLTTISAIVVVFFLPDDVKATLEDFSMVIIINLAVSLFVALFGAGLDGQVRDLRPEAQRIRRVAFSARVVDPFPFSGQAFGGVPQPFLRAADPFYLPASGLGDPRAHSGFRPSGIQAPREGRGRGLLGDGLQQDPGFVHVQGEGKTHRGQGPGRYAPSVCRQGVHRDVLQQRPAGDGPVHVGLHAYRDDPRADECRGDGDGELSFGVSRDPPVPNLGV